jgi:glutamine synthetase
MEALAAAGLEPEIMIPEYGDGQFEVPCAPAPALTAADRSVLFKEVVRDVARGLGMAVTFAPLASEDAIGNGVHIHMSLQDRDSRPVTYDGDRPSGVSAVAEGFAHGILAHLPALSAFTAPSPISALRLRPGHWSASTPALGGADREAVLRVPGVAADPPAARAEQTNLELRAVDATACPHLALAAVVRAGMSGLDGGAGSVPGGRPIPASLDAALEALERDEVASGWFPAPLLDTYLCLKREELETVAEWTADERCEAYRRVF